jgi:hypothetical protein
MSLTLINRKDLSLLTIPNIELDFIRLIQDKDIGVTSLNDSTLTVKRVYLKNEYVYFTCNDFSLSSRYNDYIYNTKTKELTVLDRSRFGTFEMEFKGNCLSFILTVEDEEDLRHEIHAQLMKVF